MRRLDKRSRNNFTPNVKKSLPLDFKSFNPQCKGREGDHLNNDNGIQCHECECSVHIQAECTNFLRKQKKGYSTIFLDEEPKDDS